MEDLVGSILDSDLPAAEQVTLMHLARQAEGTLFVGTHNDVADARGVSRGTVSEQIRSLKEKDWLSQCGQALRVVMPKNDQSNTSEDDTSSSTDGGSTSDDGGAEKGFPPHSPKKVHSTPFTPPSQRVVESAEADRPSWLDEVIDPLPIQATELGSDHPARWDYHPGDWQFDYARLGMKRMREHDMLSPMTEKKITRDGEGAVAAEWADTIRKLHELDDYSRDDIGQAFQWLFQGGNFWTDQGGIASVAALRKKTRAGDRRKFDVIYQQATSSTGGDGASGTPKVDSRPDDMRSVIR